MRDAFQRDINYIRISVTDRCNLRCVYCMPEEGVSFTSHAEILTFEEICRLLKIFSDKGIQAVKLTGGEPLVRKNLDRLVAMIKQIPGIRQVTLTTNGILLEDQLESLAAAGIDGINISMDTLNREKYRNICRRDLLDRARRGLDLLQNYPNIICKVNCVPIDMEDAEILEMAELTRNRNIQLRFIEMMPLGMGKKFETRSEEEICTVLKNAYGSLIPCTEKLGNGPCHYVSMTGFRGHVGFISAVSHKFCSSCNRIRLTSDGFLKTCLQYPYGTDLKRLLRSGADDQELEQKITEVIFAKPEGHHFGSCDRKLEEQNPMVKIGG